VVIGAAEEPLGQVRVRASAAQAERLLAWAASWPQRIWAAGGAGGLGHLLDWQLVAAGEQVLDVPPGLGRPGPAASLGQYEQERPGQCPLGGGRGAAFSRMPAGAGR